MAAIITAITIVVASAVAKAAKSRVGNFMWQRTEGAGTALNT